jgi:hypothetical protein
MYVVKSSRCLTSDINVNIDITTINNNNIINNKQQQRQALLASTFAFP